MSNFEAVLDDAISNGMNLWIKYRNNKGEISEREITPKVRNGDRLQAYCHLKEVDLNFSLRGILEVEMIVAAVDGDDGDNISAQPTYHPTPPRRTSQEALPPPTQMNVEPIHQVRNEVEWERLLRYYIDCLIIENRQQFIVDSDKIHWFPSLSEDIHRLMRGEVDLQFPKKHGRKQTDVARFLLKSKQDLIKQVCLGFPMLTLDENKVAPLLYCQLSIKDEDDHILIKTEELEVSYAALLHFGFKEEEISRFLAFLSEIDNKVGNVSLDSVQRQLIARIEELLQFELKWSEHLLPHTLRTLPGFFWVDSNFATSNLIKELGTLSERTHWSETPDGLRSLLSISPDHVYPSLSPALDSSTIYVTPVNAGQKAAIVAARSEPLTVVTGPPGTGKSQLVLNLIADSYCRGEKVLFASRNNGAVDVVMNRLQTEMEFRGAVRTGRRDMRRRAAQQIEEALNSIAVEGDARANSEIRTSYEQAKETAAKAQAQLQRVKDLIGLHQSQEAEGNYWIEQLPQWVAKIAPDTLPTYNAADIERLQNSIQDHLGSVRLLSEKQHRLAANLEAILFHNQLGDPLVAAALQVRSQWGSFGGDLLRTGDFDTVEQMLVHVHTWLQLAATVNQRAEATDASQASSECLTAFNAAVASVPPPISSWAEELIAMPSHELTLQADRFDTLSDEFHDALQTRPDPWHRLLILLGLYDPTDKARKRYKAAQQALPLRWDQISTDEGGAAEAAIVCAEVATQLRGAILHQAYDQRRTQTNHAYAEAQAWMQQQEMSFHEMVAKLPEALRADLEAHIAKDMRSPKLGPALADVESQLTDLQTQIGALATAVDYLLDENGQQFMMLAEFRQYHVRIDRSLWKVPNRVSLNVLNEHLARWHHLVSFWQTESMRRRVRQELELLPSEEASAQEVEDAAKHLIWLGSDLLQALWLDGASRLNNSQLQKVRDYAAAVQSSSSERDSTPFDRSNFIRLRTSQEASFPAALQMFPIWATTNLAAKSNFPLSAELFDLVIIDEASQCDVPSALPLLYRAKRVVVIGDPKQLRHVATLTNSSDIETAFHYAIAPDAFQYGSYSLFDVALRSVGDRPGAILLHEHFRSDTRIIGFSNREFYEDRLNIKTDLSLKGFRRSFLNDYGGICWLQVNGVTHHPEEGSAMNAEELDAVATVVARLLDSLQMHGLGSTTIGVVTPYRRQEELLEQRIQQPGDTNGRLRIGTAHKFQGDERDFIVFSPVLANGIREGSLAWLERTSNLLNVAVTRPRVTLIVVGDWEFCRSLAPESVYHRFARYVEAQRLPIYQRVDDLPLLGGPPAPIIGYILDPHNPEMNRVTLRRYLRSCREYVWWIDKYFSDRIVELLDDVFRDRTTQLRVVRLLTTWECTQPKRKDPVKGRLRDEPPDLRVEKLHALAKDLMRRGVTLELRTLPQEELNVHDRLLFQPGETINTPPFGGAYGNHQHISEYTRSAIGQNVFETYWNKARPAWDDPV